MARKGRCKFSSLGTTDDSACDKVREDDFNDKELIRVLHPRKAMLIPVSTRTIRVSPSRDNISIASAFCYLT